MSQVVEVEPRSQEYKPGVKWEFRMLIKRDDVFFAADDLPTRKAWIDALTAIMGKVSMASHSELQSRVADADQVNRELQSRMAESDQANRELQMTVEQLQDENQELEDQITILQKEAAKMRQEHMARHKDMTADMDDLQQSMDTRCELLEREVSIWRNKSAVLEKELQEQQNQHQQETEQLKSEIQEWREKAQQQSTMALENIESSSNNNSLRETITSVKYNLQALRDHMRSDNGPLVQSHIIDIKSGVNRLTDILEDSRRGWDELQTEVRECLISNNKSSSNNNGEQATAVADLRREILGDDDDTNNDDSKNMSVSAKLNVMIQMVELLQLSQTKLMESYMEHADEETKGVHIDKARMESVQAMFEDIQAKLNESTTTSTKGGHDDEEEEQALGSKLAQWMEEIKAVNREAHDKHGAQLQELVEHNMQADQDREQTIAQLLEQMHTEQEKATDKISAMIQQLQREQQQSDVPKKKETYQDGSKDTISSTTAEEVHQLVEGTQDFIERTLLVLDRYNHSGVEETVRRAVKSAFNSHLGANWQENTAKENEEKLKRYEETARTYIDRSMTGMQEHMVEYLGEMYGMIEELVKMAVARLEQQIGSSHDGAPLDHMKNGGKRDEAATSELVEVYRKLCGTRDVLEAEIERFHQERSELVKEIDDLKSTCAEVRRELEDSKIALQSIKTEYEKVQDDMQRKQQERLACELEPLIQQISKLKQLASYGSSVSGSSDEDDSVSSPSGGYVDLGHLSHPPSQVLQIDVICMKS